MLFNSLEYLIFFPIVVILYFTIVAKYRWILLLAASYYFYMSWKPVYLILILISTGIDYVAGIQIENSDRKGRKRWFLALSLVSNLGILFFFKYYNFFRDSIDILLGGPEGESFLPMLDVILPVGISFYTFQTLSYTIEVFWGKQKAERHLGRFALYVAFFPQLVAGPIERSTQLLPQFRQKFDFDYDRVTSGLKLIAWGMFKKVVIADRLSVVVDQVYQAPEAFGGLALLIGTIFFTFQIYCDFSGYSDIAIGSAQVMGFRLMENFKRPYFATSISDFWRRWHISLSSWFRDYLYIPLGGNRVAVPRWYANLLIVFVISGLWHGANWTFVVWGALHGFYLVFAILTASWRDKWSAFTGMKTRPRFHRFVQIMTTFFLASFAWIFFRAGSLSDAFLVIEKIVMDMPQFINPTYVEEGIKSLGVNRVDLILSVMLIGVMECIHFIQEEKGSLRELLSQKPMMVRWGLYYVLVLMILLLGEFNKSQFIYFQF